MTSNQRTGLLCALTLWAAGCGGALFDDHSTPGKLGLAHFGYDCVLGCDSVNGNAMAAGGAHTLIGVTVDGGGTFAAVGSSNASVATFTVSGKDVAATTGTAGTTDLQLLRGDGSLLDSVTITVVDSAKLTYPLNWPGIGPTVLTGTTQVFHVSTVGAGGHSTVGNGSVTFALSGPLTKTIDINLVQGDEVAFVGDGSSATGGSITASAPNAMVKLPVTVVPLSDITRLKATIQSTTLTASGGTLVTVLVTPFSTSGPVYGVGCIWQNSNMLTVQNQLVNDLTHAPGSMTQLLFTALGSVSATCTIGNASTTLTITHA